MAVLLECAACYQSFAAPSHAAGRRTACPWCGAPIETSQRVAAVASTAASPANSGTTAAFPPLSPSRFPRRQRGAPAVVWMLVGIGVGACVVLAALIVLAPGIFGQKDKHSAARRAEGPSARPVSTVASISSSDHVRASSKGSPVQQLQAAGQASGERQRELVRQVLREELSRAAVQVSPEPQDRRAPRGMSDRPPPIGDPEDDSPPLGLTFPERNHSRPRRAEEPDQPGAAGMKSVATKTMSVEAQDDASAIAALVARGIRCDKDDQQGRVTRVDGSFRMTDDLMQHVAKLSGLVQLKLSFADVTDTGLAHVRDLTGLRELILNQTKVTDAGLSHLERLLKLEKLDLEKTLVSDEGIQQLQALVKLEHLDLRGTKMSPAGAEKLNEALPRARIRR